MIKIENGKVVYRGTEIKLIEELAYIIRAMYQEGVVDETMLNIMVEGAKMTEEELKAENEKYRKETEKFFNDINNKIDTLMDMLKKGAGEEK